MTVMKYFLMAMLAIALGVMNTPSAMAATIEGMRLWRSPESTRLVFDLDQETDHTIFKLKKPLRLVIDVKDADFSASIKDLPLLDTPVKRIRQGRQANGDLRIVLDLREEINPRSFSLKKIAEKPPRLVVDLYDKKQQTVKTVESIIAQKNKKTPSRTASLPSGKRDIIVAIDAGHGGEDPGAIGPGRLYEKHIVLKVAKNLANRINAAKGYKAILVRTNDYYISRDKRPEKARNAHADLFISIHADGFDSPKARGASVFILSRRGASSKMASILASKANQSDLIGGADRIKLDDKEAQLAEILVDLSMNRSLEASMDVGRQVLSHMGKVTHLHSRRVESAGFAVLKSADVPSILVETGFITNPREAKKLNSLAHRNKIAKAIFDGVARYFSKKPPEGTYLAWRLNGERKQQHIITKGDTLSSIAERYQTSISMIKKENKIDGSKIRIGQILSIPTI